jgi:hypothetical protein
MKVKTPKNVVDKQSLREQELVDFNKFVVGTDDLSERTNDNIIEGKEYILVS